MGEYVAHVDRCLAEKRSKLKLLVLFRKIELSLQEIPSSVCKQGISSFSEQHSFIFFNATMNNGPAIFCAHFSHMVNELITINNTLHYGTVLYGISLMDVTPDCVTQGMHNDKLQHDAQLIKQHVLRENWQSINLYPCNIEQH